MRREIAICDSCKAQVGDVERTLEEARFLKLFPGKDICDPCLKQIKADLKNYNLDVDVDITL